MGLNFDRLAAWEFAPIEQSYEQRDTILYALGIGLGSDPMDRRQLRYVYEDCLEAFPTMAVTLGYPGLFLRHPDLGVDWRKVVHGEQSLSMHRPLPPSGNVVSRNRIETIADLGPGRHALVSVRRETFDALSGELICSQVSTTVCRGAGGFGGPPRPAQTSLPLPVTGPPDASVRSATLPQAALLYRLSGDLNPLHVDPAVASAAGFERPILHGLCTLGVAAHALAKSLWDFDAKRLRSIEARFSSPVWPGEVVETRIWHMGGGCVAFECRVPERDRVVIENGCCEYDPIEDAHD